MKKEVNTHLQHQLRQLNRMTLGTRPIHQKITRSLHRIRDMILMVRRIQRLPIPARRIQDIRANARTGARREAFGVDTRVGTGCVEVPAEVGGVVAPETGLFGVEGGAAGGVADEHAEALSPSIFVNRKRETRGEMGGNTGLNAVTWFFPCAM